MADATLAQLPNASALTGSEALYVVQGGVDKSCTVDQIHVGNIRSAASVDATGVSALGGAPAPINLPALSGGGFYRVNVYIVISHAVSNSGTLSVRVLWGDNVQTQFDALGTIGMDTPGNYLAGTVALWTPSNAPTFAAQITLSGVSDSGLGTYDYHFKVEGPL